MFACDFFVPVDARAHIGALVGVGSEAERTFEPVNDNVLEPARTDPEIVERKAEFCANARIRDKPVVRAKRD